MNGNGTDTPTAIELYSDDENINVLSTLVKRIAPWANTMTNTEIGLACRRCIGLGLDPLNQREVQIWKDKRGVKFQLAYALLCQWASQILGGHTEPVYTRLNEHELEREGLSKTDIAYWCEFVMKEDIPLIKVMMDAGWDPLQARADLTVRGLGSATLEQWSGEYFAPNTRSRAWKVQKRAYTDALRKRYGTPSQADIEKMRRMRGEEDITPSDWLVTKEDAVGGDHVILAATVAKERQQEFDPRTSEEILADNKFLLHGDGEDKEGV